jgi:hypothetical protein
MTRQARLHEQLMRLQQTELDKVHVWLTLMQQTMQSALPLASEPDELDAQALEHKRVQEAIEAEQADVYALSGFVAVVDTSSGEASSREQLEATLADIGERWMHLCKWAERRAQRLDGLADAVR